MSKAFISNFKTLLLIIAKSASTEKDCPLSYSILSNIIEAIFKPEYDEYNRNKYREYKEKIDNVMKERGSSLDKAISSRDRSIFETEAVLPDHTPQMYKQHMAWFSLFLQKHMSDKHIDAVFRYIKTLNNQV